jgi:protein TonB
MKWSLNRAVLPSFFFLFFGVRVSYGQEKIIYYNENGKAVKEKQAVLLEQNLKLNDTLWEVNLYSINGPRRVSMQCSDEKGAMLNGTYISYDRKGFCDTLGVYVHGLREGRWLVMTQKGRVLRELEFSNDNLIGKTDSAQLNERDEKLRDSLWHGRTITEKESEFPGGPTAWPLYMNTHLRYPDRAFNFGVQGTAVVGFRVEEDGYVDPRYIYLERSVEYSIDQEALKLIAGCPAWTPAVQDGKRVKSFKKQPVVFTFSRK